MTKPDPVIFFVASREAMALGSFEELKERSISAVVLAGCALGALFAGPVPFALLVLFVALVMCWEWGHLVRSRGGQDISFFVHAAAVSAAILAGLFLSEGWALALLAAGGLILLAINFRAGPGVSVLGVLYVGIPAIALIGLRGSEPYGLIAVLFILSVVWAGDIAAFVGGRLIGGTKLYPSISPNKTWAGLISAVLSACLIGAIFGSVLASAPLKHLILCAGALGLAGQLGDLAESALKRLFRVKDASHLIPGHGGFMDRMDGVVTAATVGAAIGLSIDAASPAKALILGM